MRNRLWGTQAPEQEEMRGLLSDRRENGSASASSGSAAALLDDVTRSRIAEYSDDPVVVMLLGQNGDIVKTFLQCLPEFIDRENDLQQIFRTPLDDNKFIDVIKELQNNPDLLSFVIRRFDSFKELDGNHFCFFVQLFSKFDRAQLAHLSSLEVDSSDVSDDGDYHEIPGPKNVIDALIRIKNDVDGTLRPFVNHLRTLDRQQFEDLMTALSIPDDRRIGGRLMDAISADKRRLFDKTFEEAFKHEYGIPSAGSAISHIEVAGFFVGFVGGCVASSSLVSLGNIYFSFAAFGALAGGRVGADVCRSGSEGGAVAAFNAIQSLGASSEATKDAAHAGAYCFPATTACTAAAAAAAATAATAALAAPSTVLIACIIPGALGTTCFGSIACCSFVESMKKTIKHRNDCASSASFADALIGIELPTSQQQRMPPQQQRMR